MVAMVTRIQPGAITVVPLAFMPSLMMKMKNKKGYGQLHEKVGEGGENLTRLPPNTLSTYMHKYYSLYHSAIHLSLC